MRHLQTLNRMHIIAMAAAGLILRGITAGVATAQAAPTARMTPYASYAPLPVFKHFELGVRCSRSELLDTRRQGPNGLDNANWEGHINYVGSLWGLDEIQDYLPRLYVQFALNPYTGAGIAYDYLGARTMDWGNAEKTRLGTDGDLHLHGFLYYVFLRYPVIFGITPFCEVGGAWYQAEFRESARWAAIGDGYRFEVDNANGYFLGLGVSAVLPGDWSVNLYWRQMFDVEVGARAYFEPGPKAGRAGSFPMEYRMLGLGAAYHF